jgi:PD-(D/E)XK nuclease superfamily
VEHEVVVEVKCKEAIHLVDQAQLLSYLRLLELRVGLLINFHSLLLKDGIKRLVNNYDDRYDVLVSASNEKFTAEIAGKRRRER